MNFYLNDGTHYYISDYEVKRISSFVYDSWGEKDYEATVRRDWKDIDTPVIEKEELTQRVFINALKEQQLMTPDKIKSLELFLIANSIGVENAYTALTNFIPPENVEASEDTEVSEKLRDALIGKNNINVILVKFSKKVTNEICDVLGSHFHLNNIWIEKSYIDNTYEIARDVKKDLDKTVKVLETQIKLCEKALDYPVIVLKLMQVSTGFEF